MKIKQKKYKGFTLVELIVVIAIFGILATVSVFGYLGFIEKARLSNDEQLVSQINNLIKAEDTYTYGTSNDALEIQNILKKQGISEVKTQSKGNYIFFNNDSRKAVLASLTDTGINVVYGEDSSSNSSISKLSTQSVNANFNINTLGTKATSNTTKENGQFLDYIYAPESFVKGYTLITTESRDGFCQKVNAVRKGESSESILDACDSVKNNYSNPVGTLLENMTKHTAFVNENGDQVVCKGTNKSNITVLMFSSSVNEIAENHLKNIDEMSLSILDIPSSVESITDEAIDKLCENDVINNISVSTYNENLTNYIEQKISSTSDEEAKKKYQAIKEAVVSVDKREDELVTTTISFYNSVDDSIEGSAYQTTTVTSNHKNYTITISDLKMSEKYIENNLSSLLNQTSTVFDGFYINGRKVEETTKKFTLTRDETKDSVPSELKVVAKWSTNGSSSLFNVVNSDNLDSHSNKKIEAKKINDKIAISLLNCNQISLFFSNNYKEYLIYQNDSLYNLDLDLVLQDNITLWIPYKSTFIDATFNFTSESFIPKCLNTRTKGYSVSKTKTNLYIDENLKKYSTNYKIKMVVNSKVTNNGGTVIIGSNLYSGNGDINSGAIADYYGILEIANSGKFINEQGSISSYGFLTVDEDGFFKSNKGIILESIVIKDWHGGTHAQQTSLNGVSPFNSWNLPYIQGKMVLSENSTYNAIISMNLQGTYYSKVFSLFSSEGALFNLVDEGSYLEKIFNLNDDFFSINIYGSIVDNRITISEKYILWNIIDFDTSKIPFPISNMHINVKEDSVLTLSSNKYKILPGSKITVENGGTLNINKDFATYEKFVRNDCINAWSGFTYNSTGEGLIENKGLIENNGTLNISSPNFSGNIKLGDKGKVNIKNEVNLKTSFAEGYGSGTFPTSGQFNSEQNLLTGSYFGGTNYEYGINYTKIIIDGEEHLVKDIAAVKALSNPNIQVIG